jgi:hypothetical protein
VKVNSNKQQIYVKEYLSMKSSNNNISMKNIKRRSIQYKWFHNIEHSRKQIKSIVLNKLHKKMFMLKLQKTNIYV